MVADYNGNKTNTLKSANFGFSYKITYDLLNNILEAVLSPSMEHFQISMTECIICYNISIYECGF